MAYNFQKSQMSFIKQGWHDHTGYQGYNYIIDSTAMLSNFLISRLFIGREIAKAPRCTVYEFIY